MAAALPRGTVDLVRFATAGSVDDGKSTLIGRLLYETQEIFEDQLQAVQRASVQHGSEYVNLALLTDGLRAEREQGITIDVAYRHFSTARRRYILADTPGHVQYTRNMVTGASTADAAVVLVDARKGATEQSRRHLFLSSLLRVPHILICVNKMDLVDYAEEAFEAIQDDLMPFLSRLETSDVTFIPISALNGDNVTSHSPQMAWYQGPTLLYSLEHLHVASDRNMIDVRVPVQYVIRPHLSAYHDYRGYAGQIVGGVLKTGDEVLALPSGLTTRVKALEVAGKQVDEAYPPMSVTLLLEDDLDVSRGDMICRPHNQPTVGQDLDAMVCWMGSTPLQVPGRYLVKHTTRTVRAQVKALQYRLNINTLHREAGADGLGLNEIGRVQLRTTTPLLYDSYARNRSTGSFILVDEATNDTVGAGMIVDRS